MSEYPEHGKLEAVHHFSEKIHSFLEWLQEQGIYLVKDHNHTDGCKDDHSGRYVCGYGTDEPMPLHEPEQKLLARFFEIDLVKLENEKVEMLDGCRQANANAKGEPFVKVTINKK